jgi:hypothetical protein
VSDRLQCCVPFCRRTTARSDFEQWICGDHWRLVGQTKRRVYGRYLRRWRRYGPSAYGPAASRIWRALVREAIEAAGGLR